MTDTWPPERPEMPFEPDDSHRYTGAVLPPELDHAHRERRDDLRRVEVAGQHLSLLPMGPPNYGAPLTEEALDAATSILRGEPLLDYQARKLRKAEADAALDVMRHGPPPMSVLSQLTLDAVAAEALRAHLKHRAGGGSILDPAMSTTRRLAALVEEAGEVGRELTYDGGAENADTFTYDGAGFNKDRLVKELIQTASVALTWVEFLEGRRLA